MKKYKVIIYKLGFQRYNNKIEQLKKFKSPLFEICDCKEVNHLPETDYYWGYSDDSIIKILKEQKISNTNVDLCLCFIDCPIEDNYFTRDLAFDKKTVLCSFYQAANMFSENNIDLFNYLHGIVLNEIVQIATFGEVNEQKFLHDDTRNCLFDMCGEKNDILLKYSKPKLCSKCKSKIDEKSVDSDFLPLLEKEFKTFKKALFYRILDFVKSKPILSIIIASISSIVFNLLSSGIYDLLKSLFLK